MLLTFLRLREQNNRRGFGVVEQENHIKSHGAASLLQELKGIMNRAQKSIVQSGTPKLGTSLQVSNLVSAPTISLEHIAVESVSTPNPAPTDLVDRQNLSVDRLPKKDLLARKLHQLAGPVDDFVAVSEA
jgi:hypothetical protein